MTRDHAHLIPPLKPVIPLTRVDHLISGASYPVNGTKLHATPSPDPITGHFVIGGGGGKMTTIQNCRGQMVKIGHFRP